MNSTSPTNNGKRGLLAALGDYWKAYGGKKALFTSPFLFVALVIWILIAPLWWNNGLTPLVLSILPNVLGFSIASFTMLLAIGDERFRHWLAVRRPDGKHARIFNTSVSFFHFILMQLLAIVLAIVASARIGTFFLEMIRGYASYSSIENVLYVASKSLRGLSALVAVYAIVLTLAAILHIFRLTQLYTSFSTMVSKSGKPVTDLSHERSPKVGAGKGEGNKTTDPQAKRD